MFSQKAEDVLLLLGDGDGDALLCRRCGWLWWDWEGVGKGIALFFLCSLPFSVLSLYLSPTEKGVCQDFEKTTRD